MAHYTIRDGDWQIEVDHDLERQIRAGMDDATREVADAIEREIEQIYRDARDIWPVMTGRSRRSLGRRIVLGADGTIEGQVYAGAPYARYIQSWQIAVRTPPHNEGTIERLRERGVPDPVYQRQRAREMLQEIGKAGTQAARSGSAMWIALRWPERRAADALVEELGPLIEAALAAQLEAA